MIGDLCLALALLGAVALAILRYRDDCARRHAEDWFFG
jgi:hypothetical protein